VQRQADEERMRAKGGQQLEHEKLRRVGQGHQNGAARRFHVADEMNVHPFAIRLLATLRGFDAPINRVTQAEGENGKIVDVVKNVSG
jgi:hypothetical protein